MRRTIVLDEKDIKSIIAEKWNRPYNDVTLIITEEWVGYGQDEHREKKVKAYVNEGKI